VKFNEYPTIYQYVARRRHDVKKAGPVAFYQYMRSQLPDETAKNHTAAEQNWYADKRPYYNVYPRVIEAFLRLDLTKVPVTSVSFPMDALALRLPEKSRVGQFSYQDSSYWLRSILVTKFDSIDPQSRKLLPGEKTYLIFFDVGEKGYLGDNLSVEVDDKSPIVTWRRFPIIAGETIEDCLQRSDKDHPSASTGVPIPKDIVGKVLQLVSACGLLEKDSDVLIPDILKQDRRRFDPRNPDVHLIERAHKRGKVGWNVGEDLERGEVSPHFRAAHAALYHIGPGRKKTVIRFRTGKGGGPIIVHREKITKVPTGKLDEKS